MSCYEWEQGTLKIPTKEWAGLKKAVRDEHNRVVQAQFAYCQKLYQHLEQLRETNRNAYDSARVAIDSGRLPELGTQHRWERSCSHLVWHKWMESLQRPLKKDFPPATNQTTEFSMGEHSISFDDKAHSVTWSVSENNHAIEYARQHPVAVAFFRALKGITWTRGSGGTIAGNNEYNRESRDEGGGANLVTDRYGPLGEDPWMKKLQAKAAKKTAVATRSRWY